MVNSMNGVSIEADVESATKTVSELGEGNFLEVLSMTDGNYIVCTGDVYTDEAIHATVDDLKRMRDMIDKVISRAV